jgi:putative YpdA family bacillithiol system oxidoreductase
MEDALTAAAFVIVTVLLAVRAGRRRAAAEASARPQSAPCPRCRAPVPASATFCPACGVPQQAFEMVRAARATEAAPAETGPLHAIVRTDVCVGCGTCVAACPEPGAIRLEGKVATVDRAICVGHGKCAEACPVGAIVLTRGAAVQRVEVPDLDAGFESSVPGLYIVGELGGRGLIKNAINEGKIAVERIARELRARGERLRLASAADFETGSEPYDVVIVGSGPAGLSAGLEAHRSGLRYAVLEQGSLADSIRRYPRHKLLLAEPLRVPLYGDLWVDDASKEDLLRVWEQIIARAQLRVLTGRRLENLETRDGVFHLTAGGETFRARRVVLAMGRRGTPRRLDVPGEDLPKVFYDIVEMEQFQGARMLVVGGGDSAVESALGLANQPGTGVTLSYRGDALGRVKDRNRTKLESALASGAVRALFQSQVCEIRADSVALDTAGGREVVPNDYVVIRIGGEPPYPFLQRIGVRIVAKEIALAEPQGANAA